MHPACTAYEFLLDFTPIPDNMQQHAHTDDVLQVVQKSTVLLIHFQPTLCFFSWYHLYVLCPQPVSKEWLADFDAGSAAQSALDCSPAWNYPADALINLLPTEPEHLLSYNVFDSSVPLTALTADSEPTQPHPALQPCIRFLTGIRHYIGGQKPAQHGPLTVTNRLHFLRALLLIQHLLRLVQPLANRSTDGPDLILVEVMHALFRHAPASLGFVDSLLPTTASPADHAQVQPTDELPHVPQSKAFPGESETQQHVLAVVQLSTRLLTSSLGTVWDAPAGKRPLWALLQPTLSALAAAFQCSDSSGVVTFFSDLGPLCLRLWHATAAPLHMTLCNVIDSISDFVYSAANLHLYGCTASRAVMLNSWIGTCLHMMCKACARIHQLQDPTKHVHQLYINCTSTAVAMLQVGILGQSSSSWLSSARKHTVCCTRCSAGF